ncbi:MAG: hypothetical protein V4750_02660 [Pseudomonadota bacterium]
MIEPPYPDELIEKVNAELLIVFETLNHIPFPPDQVEAIYQAHCKRVLEKHGLGHFKVKPTEYVHAADPENLQ